MGCLYCGKEILPVRRLRDRDFCSAQHRREYSERLRHGLSRLKLPEPSALQAAGFMGLIPVPGSYRLLTNAHSDPVRRAAVPELPGALGLKLRPVLTGGFLSGQALRRDGAVSPALRKAIAPVPHPPGSGIRAPAFRIPHACGAPRLEASSSVAVMDPAPVAPPVQGASCAGPRDTAPARQARVPQLSAAAHLPLVVAVPGAQVFRCFQAHAAVLAAGAPVSSDAPAARPQSTRPATPSLPLPRLAAVPVPPVAGTAAAAQAIRAASGAGVAASLLSPVPVRSAPQPPPFKLELAGAGLPGTAPSIVHAVPAAAPGAASRRMPEQDIRMFAPAMPAFRVPILVDEAAERRLLRVPRMAGFLGVRPPAAAARPAAPVRFPLASDPMPHFRLPRFFARVPARAAVVIPAVPVFFNLRTTPAGAPNEITRDAEPRLSATRSSWRLPLLAAAAQLPLSPAMPRSQAFVVTQAHAAAPEEAPMATLPISPHGGRAPVHVPVLDMEPAFRRSVAGMVNDMFLSTADSVPPANDVSREPNPAAPAPVAAAATAILPAAPAARPAPALTSAADFYRADYPLPARPDAPFRSGAIAYSAEPPRLPAFGLLPVLEVFEGESTRAARKRRRVHTLRQGQAVSGWRRWKTWGPHQYKAIAAGIILIAVLWGVGPSGMAAALTNPDWLRVVLASRATMEMRENFHSGMQAWAGGSGNWAATWTHDREGFVRPGQLALFRPSMSQANYRFEFLAQIERKGVGWAVRAGDVRNYYAVKLEVTKPGPRPLMSLVRYPVLRGMRGKAVEIPVSASLQSDTPYRVTMDVSGHRFTASIEGQEVDTWSSDLLASGGVGLFTEAGERARLHWLQVTSNDDLIGRICAFLAGSGETAQARNRQMDQPGLASLSFTPGMRTFHVAEILRTNP